MALTLASNCSNCDCIVNANCLEMDLLILILCCLGAVVGGGPEENNALLDRIGRSCHQYELIFLGLKLDVSVNHWSLSSIGSVMFVSTLDGQFLAVYRNTGRVLWAMQQDPVLKMTPDLSKGMVTIIYCFLVHIDYNSSRVGWMYACMSPFHFHDGIILQRCKLEGWDFLLALNM